MDIEDDITRHRHRGNQESETAFERVRQVIPEQRFEVLRAIRAAGKEGLTCKELAKQWGVDMNKISGRFSELKRDGMIRKIGVREDSGVMVIQEDELPPGIVPP
jgi:DNA-binding transcriptional regulator YhcF (GntR family)